MVEMQRDFNAKRALFDTNILLDALDSDRPQSACAVEALKACNGGSWLGFVTPGSLKDVYYILTKAVGEIDARESVRTLMDLLAVLPFEFECCLSAIRSDEPDFEDGLVRAAAELNDIDLIITRDASAFKHSLVRTVSAREFSEIVEPERTI